MEHTKSGESSASSGEEPNAKRRRGDVDANAKSVVVLLDSDVTVSKNGLKVFMPNTIEMAKLKKSEKGQYGKMTFTSQMTDRDVLRALHCTFPILRNRRRLGCASAVENRTRLNFHGERRLWNGKLIKRHIRGNSALYLLAEGSRESEESQVLPIVSVAARRPQDVYTSVAGPTQQKQPVLSLQTRQEGLSVPAASSMNSIPLQQSLVQDMTVGKRTSQWRSFSQQSTTMLPSGKQKNGTSSFAISGSPGCDKSAENLTFQAMQHRFTSSATSTEKSSLQVRGLSSEQSVNKDIMTTPVQHHCQADLSVKTTNWGSSSKQSMPTSVAQGSSVAATQKLKELSQISLTAGSQQSELNDQTLEQGSTWQQVPIGAAAHPKLPFQDFIQETTSTEKLSVNERKRKSHPHGHQEFPLLLTVSDEETSDSAFDSIWEEINESDHYTGQSGGTALVAAQKLSDLTQIPSTTSVSNANNQGRPELLQRGQEDLTALAAHTTGGILQQGLSLVQERQNDFIVKTIADPGAQENAQTSEQGCLQQALAAAAAHKNVPAQVFNQETTSRKSRPHGHQENSAFELLCGISDGETTDSAIDSMLEDTTESDHVTGQSGDILKEICPNKGSIKGGDRFHLIVDFVPLEIEWYKAIFQGCGEVYLQRASLSTLASITPASLQGPGKVKVTLMSLDGSWWGGETEFLYTEDPLTEEEFLSKVVKDRNMRHKLFDRMDKEMSSNKPSDEQTSDSSGKTGPRSSSLNQSRYAWSVKLLQLLVYKAAEIDGHEFIQMIFSTSAGKVVFNSYRNSATLPEDVARANGHSTLANHLQDVNSRLSKESNSDARTEGIDWLELKHAVDKEQSLHSDTDDVQILKKCRPPGYPESDDDDESDYFADDEISPCSSPSHNKVSDLEHEDHSKNTKMTESSCEKKVNEENNLPLENNNLSVSLLHLVGNQLEVNPSIKAENAGYRNEQLESDEVESHTIANDILIGKEYECTSFKTDGNDLNESAVPYRSEVENWDTLGSEMISRIEEALTGTISLHNAALPNNSSHQDSDDVMATDGSETGLDGDQKEFKMIDNDETTRSRDISVGEESSSSCSTRELPCSSELRDTRRSFFAGISQLWLALTERRNAKYWSVESLDSTVESLVCTESLDGAVESLDSTIESLEGAVESLDGAVEFLDDIRSRHAESGKLKAGSPIDSEIFEFPVSCKEPCKTMHIEAEITDGRNTEKPRDYNKKNSSISNKSTVSEISRMMSNIPENVDPGMVAWGLVDHNGGKLTIGNTGVSLTVLPEGRTEVIYIAMIDQEKEHPRVTSKESLLSPIVKCIPTGLQFQWPVILSMPDCVLFVEGAWNLKGNHGKTRLNEVITSVWEEINWKRSFIKLAKRDLEERLLDVNEAKTSDFERRLGGLRERSRASDCWFSEWAEVKFHLVPDKGKQNFATAVVKGTKNTPVLGTTGGPIYQVECEEQIAQKEHSPTSLTPYGILPVDSLDSRLWRHLLDDCSEGSVVHLLSCHFFSAANPKSALYVEELGRARALVDLMATQYSIERQISCNPYSWIYTDEITKKECNSTCLYISCYGQEVFLWILKTSGAISFRKITMGNNTPHHKLATNLDAVFATMANSIMLSEEDCNDQSVHDIGPKPDSSQILTWLYKMLIDPVSGLLEEPSIIIVPEGGLCLVPFAALLDDESGKYLSETFRIRIVPSLTTLKLIKDSPADYHSQTGALVVGDPNVGEVIYRGRLHKKFIPLPGARKEAEMIGRLLGVQPLLGQHATKQAVLQRIKSVSLIHVAGHGNAERGEIALAPLDSTTGIPQEDDYLLKMSDISQVQLRAKLVVLSCCHSGRGQIRSEGIIGMAQAFLGYGARSVLVALGALNDRATEQLMSRFYQHLVRGESASESLHQAMKWMRGNGFTKVSDWAPFTLIGDDVTFDFGK